MTHAETVERIATQIRAHGVARHRVRFRKSSVRHLVPHPGDRFERLPQVDLRGLDQILEIDPRQMTCTAQAGATFVSVVRQTLSAGLIPATVPELKGITVGGAVSGCSVESMSFRYGGFHDTCLEYEFVDGTGQVRTCSPTADAEIFHRLHGSYGTLGVLTKLRFRLVPAKPFVRVTYRHFDRLADFWTALREHCDAGQDDFIDGIIHSRDHFVLCLGRFVDTAASVSDYETGGIYYRSTAQRTQDDLSTAGYLFRYDTECHWMTRTVPPLENHWVRRLIGKWFLGSTNMITWSQRLRSILGLKRRPDVVVDVFIPARRFETFFEWYEREFRFFPLWVVPYAMPQPYPWLAAEYAGGIQDPLMIDCAVYGKPNREPHVDWSAELERKTHELHGIKTLISRNHYNEQTFWQVYDRPGYERLKGQFDPHNVFPTIFEKFGRRN